MRTPTYSIETLREFFKVNIIATMKQLKTVLGTAVDMTVYRKLHLLSYLTSYSHQGKYYSLSELARFAPGLFGLSALKAMFLVGSFPFGVVRGVLAFETPMEAKYSICSRVGVMRIGFTSFK
jgi:hypothetical protein